MKKLILILLIIICNKGYSDVVISGYLNDKTTNKILVTKLSNIATGKRITIAETYYDNKSYFKLKFKIVEPTFAHINNYQVYISPNDSIELNIVGNGTNRNDYILAKGIFSGNYMFYDEQKKKRPKIPYNFIKEEKYTQFKDSVLKALQNELAFFSKFKKLTLLHSLESLFCQISS